MSQTVSFYTYNTASILFNNNNNVVENDDNKNNNVLLAVPYITCDLDIDWYVCVLFISIN